MPETPQEVEQKVNERLRADPVLSKLGAQVLPGTVRFDEFGWNVAVGVKSEPPHMFEYVDRLTEVENQLAAEAHLKVLIAPSGITPTGHPR